MKKLRHLLILLCALSSAPAHADLSIGIGFPNVSIGINLSNYPDLVVVPGYPVYYAPRLEANFFFYDGEYWVFQDDNWYRSSWFNGPWWYVEPEYVPLFLLRIPVRYYRRPPPYFHGWRRDAPPRWGEHWGHDWERHHRGWDRWDRGVQHRPAPLPDYQRHYSGDRYPREVERQHELQQRNYRYQPRDPVVQQQRRQEPPVQRGPVQGGPVQRRVMPPPPERGAAPPDIQRPSPRRQGNENAPQQGYPPVQERRQLSQPGPSPREQRMQKSQERESRQQDRRPTQPGNEGGRESNRRQRQDQERDRDR